MSKNKCNKRYTAKYKEMVVKQVLEENMSYHETEQKYGIAHGSIQKWERIYQAEGIEGLAIERRGRGSTGRPRKFSKEIDEDLLSELQRLRAENDYLKNLQALVLEEERRQCKKHRWFKN